MIIVDSYAVIRNNSKFSYALYPLLSVVIAHKSIAQQENEDIDIDTIKIQNISILTSILCAFMVAFTSILSLTLGSHKSVLYFCNCIISRLYKWNHTVCKLLRVAFSQSAHFFEIHPGCCMTCVLN